MKNSLLDLRASDNLLLYNLYKKLDLGKPKKTSITLPLIDLLIKILRGLREDVLA